jgi:phosphonate transport system ATP-binding protein
LTVATPSAPGGAAAAASPANAPALELTGIEKRYGERHVLRGVDLSARPGELVVVLGANGSGKSTLLRCAVRLVEAEAGEIRLCGAELRGLSGRPLREARRNAAMIFQQIQLVRRRSALDNVCFGALARITAARSLTTRSFPGDVRELAMASLARVGLADRARQRADTLSGGQAQRVAIARALCQGAAVVLADEPVSALDPAAADSVLALLADIAHRDGLTVVCVLHQPELARCYGDRIVGMIDGAIVFDAPPDALEAAHIDRLYVHEQPVGE